MKSYLISADVTIGSVMTVTAKNESEARAVAAANLFTALGKEPMFDKKVFVLNERVDAVTINECESFPHCPVTENRKKDIEFEPIEFFSD